MFGYPWFSIVDVRYAPVDVTQTLDVHQTAVAFGGNATNASVANLVSNVSK